MKSFSLALGLFVAGSSFVALCPDVFGAADRTLFDFTRDSGDGRMQAAEATLSRPAVAGSGWRVTTNPSDKWPGVTLSAPAGGWDLSPFAWVMVKARNTGDRPFTLYLRVDNPGADGTKHCLTGSAGVEPGATGSVRVDLKRTVDDKLGGKLFGMRGYPVKAPGPEALDPSRVTQVVIFLSQPEVGHAFELIALTAGGEYVRPTAWTSDADPFLPFIDTFGQYRHRDWPGKVASLAELRERREAENEKLKASVPEFTKAAAWNQYGGWAAGPQLEATGFFRVQKYEGKWWLVDPAGRLFWSHGIDCVRMLDATPIDERDDWFVDPPWKQPEFAEFIQPAGHALMGHYAGRSPRCFSFAAANFKRKYGQDWKTVYPDIIHQRLRAWGLNTVANWSDPAIARLRRTPYTDNVGSRGVRNIEGSEGYWGKFPDVFDPAFRESLRRQMAAKRGGSAKDPWCLGYFSDNEMSWGDEVSLSLAALASPADQPAKQAFVSWLREKYGDISRLNAAWGTVHTNWEGLLTSTNRPPLARAGDDLRAFYTVAAESYFRTVREAIKEVAPEQLYLGCRFAWANARAAAAAAKYCDVVSYNLYRRSVADFKAEGAGDVPLIIGEFHFGALDRGMFHTGLVPVANQAARAQAYTDYVQGALRHPQIVGTHWFQYQDQPTTGRVLDEENYQIGFVDIADTPHEETVSASRRVGQAMYPLRAER
ncbi:MAG: beta-galactosidase [Verrucomicrobia bacterium]|nr:beta-galactosidase [Verrucomicrobiota bacterium]